MKPFLLFLSLALCVAGQAQTSFRGFIKDGQGKVVPLANVELKPTAADTIIAATQADSNGSYLFIRVLPGNYRLIATAVGFRKDSIVVSVGAQNNERPPTLVLLRETKVLDRLVINADTKPIQAKGGKLVYQIDKSISAAGSTAFDMLRRTPGVSVDADDNISLKGSPAVNVMIDGKMTYLTAQQLSAYLKSLPAESLSRIEVSSTPSSEYDAAGNSGILNLVIKKMNREGYALNLNASGAIGRYGQTAEGLAGNIRRKSFNLFGGYSYGFNKSYMNRSSFRSLSNNGTITSYDRHSYDPTTSRNHNYRAGIDFYLHKNTQLGFVYSGASDLWKRTAGGPTYLRNQGGHIDSIALNHNENDEPSTNSAYNVNFSTAWDTLGKKLEANADYLHYDNKPVGSLGNEMVSAAGNPLQPYQLLAFSQPHLLSIRSFRLDLTLPYRSMSWKGGLKYSYVNSDNDFSYDSLINGAYVHSQALSNHFIYDEKIYAAYLSSSKPLSATISLDAGLRLEQTQSTGNSVTLKTVTHHEYTNAFPYLSLTKTFGGGNDLNLSITRRINRPVYANLNPFRYFFDKYSYVQGNPYLQPELSWNLAGTYTYKHEYIATATYAYTNNAILSFAVQDTGTGVLRIGSYNFSHKVTADLLLVIPVKAASWWSLQNTIDITYLSYVYYTGTTIFHPHRLGVDAQSIHNLTLPKGFNAEVNIHYISPMLNGLYLLQNYFQTDAGLKKSFSNKRLDVKLSCIDLFRSDRYWGYSVYGPTNVRYNHRPDTRRVKLALAYRFGGKLSAGRIKTLEEQSRL